MKALTVVRSTLSGLMQRKSGDITWDRFAELMAITRTSKSGQVVGWKQALRCSAALACVRVIANGIAGVPLKLFQEDEATGKKLPARAHPLYRLLHRKPNEWQTSFEFRETLAMHLVVCGRAYAFKVIAQGKLVELIPFEPNRVEAKLQPDGYTLRYRVVGRDGTVLDVPANLMWHLKGPSWCGYEGLDALELAREALGLSIAAESSQAELHKNGLRPSGVYSVEGELDEPQYVMLRKFLAENFAGKNSAAPMILDRNAKWLSSTMSGVDSQHLETRRFQVEEVCRAMGVMPIMAFSSDKATTYASAEAMFQAHVVHTLAPWWERLEQSIDCNLLSEADDRAGVYAKFIGQALLRGSMKDRADYYAKALGSGGSPAWLTQDEIRGMEEMNPMGGTAAALPVPTNVAKPAPAPAPTPDPTPVN
jgi:HK97 family phage portal protein